MTNSQIKNLSECRAEFEKWFESEYTPEEATLNSAFGLNLWSAYKAAWSHNSSMADLDAQKQPNVRDKQSCISDVEAKPIEHTQDNDKNLSEHGYGYYTCSEYYTKYADERIIDYGLKDLTLLPKGVITKPDSDRLALIVPESRTIYENDGKQKYQSITATYSIYPNFSMGYVNLDVIGYGITKEEARANLLENLRNALANTENGG